MNMKLHMNEIKAFLIMRGYDMKWIDEFIFHEFVSKDREEVTLGEIVDSWFCRS